MITPAEARAAAGLTRRPYYVSKIARAIGVSIRVNPNLAGGLGVWLPRSREIVLRSPEMRWRNQAAAWEELGHAQCGHGLTDGGPRWSNYGNPRTDDLNGEGADARATGWETIIPAGELTRDIQLFEFNSLRRLCDAYKCDPRLMRMRLDEIGIRYGDYTEPVRDDIGRYETHKAAPSWRRERAEALAAAGGRCEECGARVRLDLHHPNYIPDGNFAIGQGEILCRECHERRHRVGTVHGQLTLL